MPHTCWGIAPSSTVCKAKSRRTSIFIASGCSWHYSLLISASPVLGRTCLLVPVGYFSLLVYQNTCLIRDVWQLLFDLSAMWNKYFTCRKSSFPNLKYDWWWCYHICLLRISSSRGNTSLNTTSHGCHLQDFFTISCFSINVTSTYIANCNPVSETASKDCIPQG